MRFISLTLAALLPQVLPGAVAAQNQGWGVGAEIGSASFHGHSRETDTDPGASGHPGTSSTLAMRLDRTAQIFRFSLGLLRASTGLEVDDGEISVEAKGTLTLIEVSPEVSFALLHLKDNVLRAHVGMVIDRWSVDGGDSRMVIGGLGGASLEVPLKGRLDLQLRWDLALTGSLFHQDEVPAGYELRSGIKQRWGLGARFRL